MIELLYLYTSQGWFYMVQISDASYMLEELVYFHFCTGASYHEVSLVGPEHGSGTEGSCCSMLLHLKFGWSGRNFDTTPILNFRDTLLPNSTKCIPQVDGGPPYLWILNYGDPQTPNCKLSSLCPPPLTNLVSLRTLRVSILMPTSWTHSCKTIKFSKFPTLKVISRDTVNYP